MENHPGRFSNDEFEILVSSLKGTYHQFCFNKVGHEKISGKPYKDFEYIWTNVLVALRHYYLINFAKIYDKESYSIKSGEKITLSIFRIISENKFSKESIETIKKIKKMRNEMLAHLEAKVVLQGKNCEKDYGLGFKGEEIEVLIGETFNLLNEIRASYGYTHELNQDREKALIRERFEKWYNVFEKN
jgi:hypothetical protein